MRKIILFIWVMVMQIMLFAANDTSIPKYVSEYMIQENIPSNAEVYQYTKQSAITTIMGNKITLPSTGYLFFIDEYPTANWSHPCRYVWFDLNQKNSRTIKDDWFPSDMEEWKLISKITSVPLKTYKKSNSGNRTTIRKLSSTANNNYAVIISGGINKGNNHIRYWNDCQAIYSTLVYEYGYLDNHIYVLMSDGTNPAYDRRLLNDSYDSSPLDLDGDGDNDIQYAATKKDITTVFDLLSRKLTTKDFLFIFTTDHGGQKSGDDVYMCLWGENITDAEFAKEVNKVKAGNISIVMEQCHSGGFISDLTANNRVIATACTANENSWTKAGLLYNEFVYHWTSAVRGYTPEGNIVNADTNNDGLISMKEAFEYAKKQDKQNEHPQYKSISSALGDKLSLYGNDCATIYVKNQTITSNTTIIGCDINVSNVIIQNNSSVVIDAGNSTNINGPFEVELGSTLEIK